MPDRIVTEQEVLARLTPYVKSVDPVNSETQCAMIDIKTLIADMVVVAKVGGMPFEILMGELLSAWLGVEPLEPEEKVD